MKNYDSATAPIDNNTPASDGREMTRHWAANLTERRSIIAFWEWLEKECGRDATLFEMNIEDLLDQYHKIDQKKLDEERRALLSSIELDT